LRNACTCSDLAMQAETTVPAVTWAKHQEKKRSYGIKRRGKKNW
jgi:hypothetical protein